MSSSVLKFQRDLALADATIVRLTNEIIEMKRVGAIFDERLIQESCSAVRANDRAEVAEALVEEMSVQAACLLRSHDEIGKTLAVLATIHQPRPANATIGKTRPNAPQSVPQKD